MEHVGAVAMKLASVAGADHRAGTSDVDHAAAAVFGGRELVGATPAQCVSVKRTVGINILSPVQTVF